MTTTATCAAPPTRTRPSRCTPTPAHAHAHACACAHAHACACAHAHACACACAHAHACALDRRFAEQFLAQLDDAGASGWGRRPSALRYHLAQCPLERVPALQADAHELLGAACDAACASLGRTTQPVQTNLWFAIGATTSGLHYDAFDNLLLLLRGRKRLLLLPPSASAELAPRPAHDASARTLRRPNPNGGAVTLTLTLTLTLTRPAHGASANHSRLG